MAQDWTNFKDHIVEGDSRLTPAPTSSENGKVLKVVNGAASWESAAEGDVKKSDFNGIEAIGDRYTMADIKSKLNAIIATLKGTAAVAIMAMMPLFGFGEVQTARLDALYNDSLVVTNVTGFSGVTTNAVRDIVSDKRDLTNNVCAATTFGAPFGPWSRDNLPSGVTWNAQPVYDASIDLWYWAYNGGSAQSEEGGADATSLTFGYGSGFTSTRTATPIALSNDTFVTHAFVTNAVSQAGDSATVSALVTTTATHTATIAGWENYWSGDKVRLSVTNYYGNTSGELPRLRIEEFDHSTTTTVDGVQIVSNVYRTVWDEDARHTNYQAKVDAEIEQISTNVLTAAWQQTTVQLAGKAPRAWQDVTSAGEAAPENTVWMTAPNTVFAGGTEYAHVAVGEGTICVLVDNGAPVYTEGSDEGTFRFRDSTGGHYFGFDIRDHYELGCRTDSISVNSSMHLVSLMYDLTSSGNPYIMHSTNLVEWTDATVTWETDPPAGTKICYIDCGTDPKGFYKAEFRYAASSKFVTNMAADFLSGILATNETGVGTSTQVKVYPVATTTGVVWRVEY